MVGFALVGEPLSGSGVERLIAAADRVEALVADAVRLRAALEEVRRLHAPRLVCAGCGDPYKPHEVDCVDDGPLMAVCSICCFAGNGWTDECQDAHDHVTGGPCCSTVEVLVRAGL